MLADIEGRHQINILQKIRVLQILQGSYNNQKFNASFTAVAASSYSRMMWLYTFKTTASVSPISCAIFLIEIWGI